MGEEGQAYEIPVDGGNGPLYTGARGLLGSDKHEVELEGFRMELEAALKVGEENGSESKVAKFGGGTSY